MGKSLGQERVRATFNPSSNKLVDDIKMRAANLIDLFEEHKLLGGANYAEVNRLWSLAQTAIEEAAMWAVKAATA